MVPPWMVSKDARWRYGKSVNNVSNEHQNEQKASSHNRSFLEIGYMVEMIGI
jgi:hypothetical protein